MTNLRSSILLFVSSVLISSNFAAYPRHQAPASGSQRPAGTGRPYSSTDLKSRPPVNVPQAQSPVTFVDFTPLSGISFSPRLGIGRRGEQVFFMLNREVGLERTIRGLSANFKVMLYGYGSSENNWDAVYVQTPKQ